MLRAAARTDASGASDNDGGQNVDQQTEAQTQAAVDLCVSAFGGLHGAINCAGTSPLLTMVIVSRLQIL